MDIPTVRYAHADDGSAIAYTVVGSGPAFVHLPPTFSHAQLLWRDGGIGGWRQQLASRFKLISFDARGQGMSSRGLTDAYCADDDVGDLTCVVEKTTSGPCILYGVLYGAHVAIRYAVRHPERVSALIVMNARPDSGAGPLSGVPDLVADWDRFIDTLALTAFAATDLDSARHFFGASSSRQDFLKRAEVSRRSNIEELASQVQVPTLVLSATDRYWSTGSEDGGRRLASLIPESEFFAFDAVNAGLIAPKGQPITQLTVLDAFLADHHLIGDQSGPGARLSRRELEVLRLLTDGKSNKQIADELVISSNTVIRHVSSILAKTGARNRTEAAAYAHRNRLAYE